MTNCKNGHTLTSDNIVHNSWGCRECRVCANKRHSEWKKVRRDGKKWLTMLVTLGELRSNRSVKTI